MTAVYSNYSWEPMSRTKAIKAIIGRVETNPVLTCEGTVIPIHDKWNSLASLSITSLSLRDRFVKSVVKLVNRLLFSIV